MKKEINYQIDKINSSQKLSRIINFKNNISNKAFDFPGVMFYVTSKDEKDAVISYYNQDKPHKYIFGYVVPFHKMTQITPFLSNALPHNINIMCDIENERFWTKLKEPNLLEQFIPEDLIEEVENITTTKSIKIKKKSHFEFWKRVTANKKSLIPIIMNYIDFQCIKKFGIDYVTAISPMLSSKYDIDFIEIIYTLTKKLYNEEVSKFESNGKQIGLHLNFHTDFLTKNNIIQLIRMIERVNPEFIIIKFYPGDIIDKDSLKSIHEYAIEELGKIASIMEIPIFYFNSHNEGINSHRNGINIFVECFKPHYKVLKESGMRANQVKRMKIINPFFESGKIYDRDSKMFLSRSEYISRLKKVSTKEGVSTEIEGLNSMTHRAFRDYSKWILMESRNLEEENLHDMIRKNKSMEL